MKRKLVYSALLTAVIGLSACSETGYYIYEAPYTYKPGDPRYEAVGAEPPRQMPVHPGVEYNRYAWGNPQNPYSYADDSVTVIPLNEALDGQTPPSYMVSPQPVLPITDQPVLPAETSAYFGFNQVGDEDYLSQQAYPTYQGYYQPPPMDYIMPPSQMSIMFAYGSDSLSAEDLRAIGRFADEAKRRGFYMIEIRGYASAPNAPASKTKSEVVNLKMSAKRALAVSTALIKEGIDPMFLRTVSLGASMASGIPEEDRRVEIEILSQ